MYVKENINPTGKKRTDCVIRAIAKGEGKTWLEIYDDLTVVGRKLYSVQNDPCVYGEYLSKYSNIEVKYEIDGSKKRYTVKDVCNFKGTYIVQIANHLTTVIDGKYYDTWDCGKKAAYKIWKIK